ncbi:esterase/lipase family protein [Serratia sp. L9]|uniref:esterase/lipase family protein n=1 Tax=Serratia sp. L9 TaxID=3423946 RepID=UPI003D66A4A6
MANANAPFHPIIYVRGFAMTRNEIDETTLDPFNGFNLGSTTLRASASNKERPRKFVFESPVIRLASEFGYSDVYEDGLDILDPGWEFDASGKPTGNVLNSKSIVIYRYYDSASTVFGSGKTLSIEEAAVGLAAVVKEVRRLLLANPRSGIDKEEDFRCYLVAHSMGGLVCRAFLQNPTLDPGKLAKSVDKFFTYATPHNGIDMLGLNVPSWLSSMDISNFNRSGRMKDYLALDQAYKNHDRVDLIPESSLASSRIFTMVGTNRMDYEVAAGLSRAFVGNGSDGLVKIKNATLNGLNKDGSIGAPCAKAFTYRAHSGPFGIVNSEEAFQNLSRFLFGDVRVDIWLDIEDVRLPPEVLKSADGDEKKVDAIYQIELLASPRGKLWSLTRRMAEEDSVACMTQAEWRNQPSHYLSSVFLANSAKVNPRRPSLSYSLILGVKIPDYEVDRRLRLNEHFEGVTCSITH